MKKLLLFSLFFSACSIGSGTPRIINGFVQSSKTDNNDNPTEIYIFDSKDEYFVEENDIQKQLLDNTDRRVVVKGDISSSFSGKKYITIHEVQFLD